MHVYRLALLAAFLPASVLHAGGFAFNKNFTVLAPAHPTQEAGQRLAEQVLAEAEQYRRQIATSWLGESLPAGAGPTTINIEFVTGAPSAKIWIKDGPGIEFSTIYLRCSPAGIPSEVLAHEIAHVVLAAKYPHPHRLAAWLEEGIASRYDDPQRVAIRRRLIDLFVTTNNWPRLTMILAAESISAQDQSSYATAVSLTDFLLTRKSKQTLLEFGNAAGHMGWDAALQKHYGISSVSQLQSDWQIWLRQTRRFAKATSSNLTR